MNVRVNARAFSAAVLCLQLAATGAPSAADAPSRVRFSIAADPATLNPLFAHADANVVEEQLARLSFEPFVDIDASGRMFPALLAQIPTPANGGISPDGRTLTYHLRAGVRWSDGVPVGADDVLFTLRAILDPANPVASREGYDLIDRADALGPTTVRFHLRHAWAPAVATFFSYGTVPQFVLPKHILATQAPLDRAPFNLAPGVGDGPFTLSAWRHGDRLLYVANDRYWRGKPGVSRIDVRIVPDPNTNLLLLRSGELDFNLVAPLQIRALADAPGIALARVPTALVAGIAMNLAHPPLDDARVRRAIAASIDRDAIARTIALGRYPVTGSDRPHFSWAYDARVREPAFDSRAADALLDAAGWRRDASGGMRSRGGRPLQLTYVQFPESTTGVRVATFVQAALRTRGIDVTIKSISNAQLFLPVSGMLASGAFDLAYVPWRMGADPDDRFIFDCRAAANYMRYCNPEVARLEETASATADRARRAAAYRAIDRIVARDVPVLYLFNPTYTYAYRTDLEGFNPNPFTPTWNAYGWRVRSR